MSQAERSFRADLAIPGSAVLLAAMPAEAALSLTDPEYRTMARTGLAMPIITSGLACAMCRAALDTLGLHSHTCPGQARRRHDVVER
eukprot:8597758-Alexandrium_andersonii.AAC.1